MSIELYEPITKERASAILQVSIRTMDHWIQQGYMPANIKIGRQCYWHPSVFYAWLNERLNHVPSVTAAPEEKQLSPTAISQEAQSSALIPAPAAAAKVRHSYRHSDASSAKERNRARIKKLNEPPAQADATQGVLSDSVTALAWMFPGEGIIHIAALKRAAAYDLSGLLRSNLISSTGISLSKLAWNSISTNAEDKDKWRRIPLFPVALDAPTRRSDQLRRFP